MSIAKPTAIGLGAIFALVALTSATCTFVNGRLKENEVGLVTTSGAINYVQKDPGYTCFPFCYPTTDVLKFKTFNDTFTMSAGKGADAGGDKKGETAQNRQIFLRSKDDKFIESISISIISRVNKSDKVSALYTEFRADDSDAEQNALKIRDDLQVLATQPLVDVIRSYDALDIQDSGDEIGKKLTEALQAAVDKRLGINPDSTDKPLLITDIVLGGVKFDPETENLLKQKIFAKEQAAIADISKAAALKQAESSSAQAQVTSQVVGALLKAGAPPSQIANLTCIDLKRQKQLPENTNCFGLSLDAK